jgi:hypothetical protein
MSRPAPPQYSRDGTWWWDGSQWVRVTPDWPPSVPEAAPAEPPVPAEPRVSALSRIRLPRVPLVMLVALGAAFGMLVAGIGIAWAVQHRPLPAPATPTPSTGQVATPTPLPSLPPEKYPYRYMPGLTVTEILRQLQSNGFTCDSPQQERDSGLARWRCQRQVDTVTSSVTIWAHDDARVHLIDAQVLATTQKPPLGTVQSLFQSLAGLPLKQQPDLAAQAKDWVRANADGNGYTLFGQTVYSTTPAWQSYFLEMDAGLVR